MIVVLVEVTPAGEVVETSREAMTFARDLAAAGGGVPRTHGRGHMAAAHSSLRRDGALLHSLRAP